MTTEHPYRAPGETKKTPEYPRVVVQLDDRRLVQSKAHVFVVERALSIVDALGRSTTIWKAEPAIVIGQPDHHNPPVVNGDLILWLCEQLARLA